MEPQISTLTPEVIQIIQQATLIAQKPYLTFKEALLYLGVKKSFLFKKMNDFKFSTTPAGFYRKTDLDRIMSELPKETNLAKSPIET